jgi:predicted nucleic acid-binding protein
MSEFKVYDCSNDEMVDLTQERIDTTQSDLIRLALQRTIVMQIMSLDKNSLVKIRDCIQNEKF